MKNVKLFLSAIALVTIVSGALAFKPAFGKGNLFCKPTPTGVCSTTADFKVEVGGTLTEYCGTTHPLCESNTTTQTSGLKNLGE